MGSLLLNVLWKKTLPELLAGMTLCVIKGIGTKIYN